VHRGEELGLSRRVHESRITGNDVEARRRFSQNDASSRRERASGEDLISARVRRRENEPVEVDG
jgi:hypothetical protein